MRLVTTWHTLPRSGKLAVVLWVALVAGVAGRVALSKPGAQSVVPIYRTAGEKWLAGTDIYALVPGQDVYRNPPGVAALFAPISLLPEKTGAILWRLGTTGLFLFALTRFRRDVLPDLPSDRAGAMFALAAVLALPAVNNGQFNLVLAAVGLGGAAAVARGKWWEAAGWFAAGGWVKVYPLAVGLLVAAAFPRKLAGRLAVVTAVGFAAPFALQNPGYVADQYRGFVHELGQENRMLAGPERVPRDWTCVARSWTPWVPAGATVKLVMFAAAAGCGLMVVAISLPLGGGRVRVGVASGGMASPPPQPSPLKGEGEHAARRVLVLAVALGSVWMTTFGPATEAHTYVVLAGIAAAVAVTPMARWATAFAWVGCGLMVAVVLRPMFPHDWRFTLLGPQAVGAVLVGVAVVGETFRGSGQLNARVLRIRLRPGVVR